MARSLKKGPYISERLHKHLEGKRPGEVQAVKTWERSALITPEMIGYSFAVHNGKEFIVVKLTEEMVGHKLGEFAATTKFVRHGGKMQKEIEKK